jgi:hypothetical protein
VISLDLTGAVPIAADDANQKPVSPLLYFVNQVEAAAPAAGNVDNPMILRDAGVDRCRGQD